MMRHILATEYLNGSNLESLWRIMGHASLSTTQRYLHLLKADLVDPHKSFLPGDRC